MDKKLKKYGKSYVVTFTREERESLKMDAGDFLDIEIKEVKKKNVEQM